MQTIHENNRQVEPVKTIFLKSASCPRKIGRKMERKNLLNAGEKYLNKSTLNVIKKRITRIDKVSSLELNK